MSEIAVAPAVAVTGEAVNNDVDLKAKAVSAKLEAFARLLDPFAEGSKFIPINEPGAAEEGSNATESDNGAVSEEKSDGDTKDGTIAEESDSKVVSPAIASVHSFIMSTVSQKVFAAAQFPAVTAIIRADRVVRCFQSKPSRSSATYCRSTATYALLVTKLYCFETLF